MIKGVAYFPLKENSDAEYMWKFWVEKMAPSHDLNRWRNLRYYSISRCIKTEYGKGTLWGICEMRWDTMKDYEEDYAQLDSNPESSKWKKIWEDMTGEMTVIVMEEKIVVQDGKMLLKFVP